MQGYWDTLLANKHQIDTSNLRSKPRAYFEKTTSLAPDNPFSGIAQGYWLAPPKPKLR